MYARMRKAATLVAITLVVLIGACQDPAASLQNGAAQQAPAVKIADPQSPDMLVSPPPIEATTFIAAGRLHESQGRLLEAVRQYELASAEAPDNVDILNHIGVLYDRIGNSKMAQRAYLRAIDLVPNDARLHNNLAFSYILRRNWPEAEIALTRAVELAPEFARARINLGMVLAQQNRFDAAFEQFEYVLPPQDAWYNLGLMYQSRRKDVEAAYAYKRALEADPDLTAAVNQLARMSSQTLGAADDKIEQWRQQEQEKALALAAAQAEAARIEAQRRAAEEAAEMQRTADLASAEATPVETPPVDMTPLASPAFDKPVEADDGFADRVAVAPAVRTYVPYDEDAAFVVVPQGLLGSPFAATQPASDAGLDGAAAVAPFEAMMQADVPADAHGMSMRPADKTRGDALSTDDAVYSDDAAKRGSELSHDEPAGEPRSDAGNDAGQAWWNSLDDVEPIFATLRKGLTLLNTPATNGASDANVNDRAEAQADPAKSVSRTAVTPNPREVAATMANLDALLPAWQQSEPQRFEQYAWEAECVASSGDAWFDWQYSPSPRSQAQPAKTEKPVDVESE